MYFKENPLLIPLAMTSFGPDGGIVSTTEEMMVFIRAFFRGDLFPPDYFNEMKQWNKIFYPLEYGVGLARFKLPRLFSPFKPMPELLGHSGLSGAFAFYSPDKNVYLTGTVNQIHHPDISFKLMLQLINVLQQQG
ncbi:MAG: serine hydrolase [Chloroflexi bacterium]|nr:serine hydrolase [Chloroflexota bacterium]